MMLYKSFDKLGVFHRVGFTIDEMPKGIKALKVETFSVYTHAKEYVFWMKETEDYNKKTDWNAEINEHHTTVAQAFFEDFKSYLRGEPKGVIPYKIIIK